MHVVITDDHKLFRKGMIALLSDFDFVKKIDEAGDGVELLNLLKQSETLPDIILLDARMPVMDGEEATKEIRKQYPDIKIIILTMEDDEQFIFQMINVGVNGYLLKNVDTDELEQALQKVIEKGFYFPGDISALLLNNFLKNTKHPDETHCDLTNRELQVLELICKELTAAEIGVELSLSTRTIEGYKRSLLEKTGAKNMAGLVIYAIKNKLVEI